MDREEPEHPLVVLAQLAIRSAPATVVRDGVIRKRAFWPLLERSRRAQHRAAEGAQEDRRPADLERLVGQADEVAVAAERLDPGRARRQKSSSSVGRRMLDGDRVEHRPDDRRRRLPGLRRRSPPSQRGAISRAIRIISARTAVELPLGPLADPAGTSSTRPHRVGHLRGEEVRARVGLRPRIDGRTTSRRCVSKPASDVRGRRPRRAQPGRIAATRGIVGRGRRFPGFDRLVDDRDQAGPLLEGVLGVESVDGAAVDPDEDLRAASITAGSVSARAAIDSSRSASGANSRLEQAEEPAADHVDPPIGLHASSSRRQSLNLGSPSSPSRRSRSTRSSSVRTSGSKAETNDEHPAVNSTRRPGRRATVGPEAVVVVVAGARREDRVESEVSLEEGVDALGEVGHGERV